MRRIEAMLSMGLFTLACAAMAGAQQTRTEAIQGMRKTKPSEMDPTYTKAAPFAQQLVDQALAANPSVLLMAIHAAVPGHKNLIVASNFGRIGKIGDEDDMRCINTGKDNLEVDPTGKHFEAELPLQDKAGKTIGALGVVFNYKPGDDKIAMAKTAHAIADTMKAQLPTEMSLLKPAN
ncbi:MAG: hypothetical protein HIU93_16695 [Acidobacteria bacterium]|nr:hypothetical protein [Acidobacteriota bacterium]